MKNIFKGSLAFILASTFTISTTVSANETKLEAYETVDLQEVKTQLGTVQAETPSLVPGDFFYFAKIALEKIKLALTFDSSEEAKLLAEYASERLAEAGILYGEGKEEEALEVIQTALEYIENSQSIIDEKTAAEEGSKEQDTAVEEGTNTEEEAFQDDSIVDEDANTDEQTDESVSDEGDSEEQGQYTEAQDALRNNIAALSAAMQHVGNDNAKAQLQKNIEKTRAKIQKKLAKLEKKYGKAVVENQKADLNETKSPEVNSDEADVITNANADAVSLPDDIAVPMEAAELDASITAPSAPAVSAPAITQAEKGYGKEKPGEKKEKNEKKNENHRVDKGNGNKKE